MWYFDRQDTEVMNLRRTDVLKVGTAENPIPMIEWDEYLMQKNYLEASFKMSKDNLISLGKWMLVPFAINGAAKLGGTGFGRFRTWKDGKYSSMGYEARSGFERNQKFLVYAKMNKLDVYFNQIGVRTTDIAALTAKYNEALARATTEAQKARVTQAYENIVLEIGGMVHSYRQLPQFLDSYAKVLYGPTGGRQQVYRLIHEYDRILSKRYGVAS